MDKVPPTVTISASPRELFQLMHFLVTTPVPDVKEGDARHELFQQLGLGDVAVEAGFLGSAERSPWEGADLRGFELDPPQLEFLRQVLSRAMPGNTSAVLSPLRRRLPPAL